MSSKNRILLPHIINALSQTLNYQDNFDGIVRQVEDDLKANDQSVENVAQDVKKSLQVAVDFGLIGATDDVFRLKFNPNASPPFGTPEIQYLAVDERNGEYQSSSEENGHVTRNRGQEEDGENDSNRTLNDDDSEDGFVDIGVQRAAGCPSGFCQYQPKMVARSRRKRRSKSRRRGTTRSRSRRKRSGRSRRRTR